MIFKDFKINAEPFFSEVSCKKCRNYCKGVDDGWFSQVFYCPKDEIIYVLKLVKVPTKKIKKEILEELKEKYKSNT